MSKKLVKRQNVEGNTEGHTLDMEKVLKGSLIGTVLANILIKNIGDGNRCMPLNFAGDTKLGSTISISE